jgi:hypothetical protein
MVKVFAQHSGIKPTAPLFATTVPTVRKRLRSQVLVSFEFKDSTLA